MWRPAQAGLRAASVSMVGTRKGRGIKQLLIVAFVYGTTAVVCAALVAVLIVGAKPPTAAGAQPPPEITVETPSADVVEVSVRGGPQVRRPGPSWRCSWRMVAIDAVDGVIPGVPSFIALHRLYERYNCENPNHNGSVWVPITTGSSALLAGLQDRMAAVLPRPELQLTPKRPEGWVIVQLPIDIRASGSGESIETLEVVVTASIGGPNPAAVTATAKPVRLEFFPGDPARPDDVVSCTPGEAAAPYDPAKPGRCSYTYRNTSSALGDEGFSSRLRLHWEVSYRSSIGSAGLGAGTLEIEPTEAIQPVAVGEIRALVDCIGIDC